MKVHVLNLTRESGYMYFIDKEGDVSRTLLRRKGRTSEKQPQEKVAKTPITREFGYLYFQDKDGDVSRVVQARGRKAKE